MPFLAAKDGAQLFYKDWGSGRPVVLIHGWPLDADMWEFQQPALTEAGLRTIAYDRRGFGRSDQTWGGYDYDTFADDLKAVLDALDLQDVALIGFSMGGGEIARYMSRHGGARVTRAALVSAVTPYMLKTADNPKGVDPSVFTGMIDGLKKDRPSFMATFAKTFFGVGMLSSPVSSDLIQWTGNLAMLASPKATIASVTAFGETDFRADMSAFHVPTLVIHGDADQTVPIDVSGKANAAAIPSAKLVVYEGAPHAIPFTHAERLNGDLVAFLRG
ncbi:MULTISPECIES: alpha/beta fold hydrolase [Methylobacterium]|uniref:Pimeloyl-ACP methyl ester carboxylesterase n=1 Tax=Methylobacterium phyllostachyos TaxID=582672 RepID=A0A1G9U150_9HYPH|nr:alpha/beta hydrolase [Methylobacterium phyllostachyos]SDM53602.1 Pimeloyl-ACP methyl ester carboxylesterase [Methylobacterium phyllostachyos]